MKQEEQADLETIAVLKNMIKIIELEDLADMYARGFTDADR